MVSTDTSLFDSCSTQNDKNFTPGLKINLSVGPRSFLEGLDGSLSRNGVRTVKEKYRFCFFLTIPIAIIIALDVIGALG